MKLKNILAALLFTALLFLISIYLQARSPIPATSSQRLEHELNHKHPMPMNAMSHHQCEKVFKTHIFQIVADRMGISIINYLHHKVQNRAVICFTSVLPARMFITFTLADIRAILRKSIDITLNL